MPERHDVKVFVRIRPLVGEEVKRGDTEVSYDVEGGETQTVSFK
ncbi:hypothetical protein KIPB_008677, partial [Kipferlia bialata]|eukprot:g8677.t1